MLTGAALRTPSAVQSPAAVAIVCLIAGCGGFLLNALSLPLGWGLEILLGNALVWSVLRPLGPVPAVLALSLASTQTILLWGHPWAWAVWSLEAAVVSLLYRRLSPVVIDLGFWLLLGGPLIALAYGGLMHMDTPSRTLVVLKQSLNGVLCVTLGELGYLAAAEVVRRVGRFQPPTMPLRAVAHATVIALVLVPALATALLGAESLQGSVEAGLHRRLDNALDSARRAAQAWLDAPEQRASLVGRGAAAPADCNGPGPSDNDRPLADRAVECPEPATPRQRPTPSSDR